MTTIDQTAQQVYDSANGFDDIAVKKAFGASLLSLKDDAMTFGRALAFIVAKRDGLNDMQAKQTVLGLSNAALSDYFAVGESDEETDERREAAKTEARAMAEFCIRTGQSKDTYLSLTALEREAFVEVHNEDAS
jgi:hypothetical protein